MPAVPAAGRASFKRRGVLDFCGSTSRHFPPFGWVHVVGVVLCREQWNHRTWLASSPSK